MAADRSPAYLGAEPGNLARHSCTDRTRLGRAGLYHLLPQPPLDSATLKPPSAWEAFQFRDGSGAEAVVLVFRNLSLAGETTIVPKSLNPAATYEVTKDNGQVQTISGDSLLTTGLPVRLLPLTSARYRIRQRR